MQALNPLTVLHITLSSGHIFSLTSVHQNHRKPPNFQYLEDRNPVHSRRFHGDALDTAFREPISQSFQVASKGSELANVLLSSVRGDTDPMLLGTNIEASGGWIDFFPTVLDGYLFLLLLLRF